MRSQTARKTQSIKIPINLPQGVYFITLDINPANENGEQLIATIEKTDGTTEMFKSNIPTVSYSSGNLGITFNFSTL